jgi:hypothetical protein
MDPRPSSFSVRIWPYVVAFAVLALVFSTSTELALAQEADQPKAPTITVQDVFGGQIFGYGVDQLGNEGILSEIVTLPDGKLHIATETFSQTTGKILKVVAQKTETNDNFISWGVLGSHVGLMELDTAPGIFVTKRSFSILDPLSGNKFTRQWTPPVDGKTQALEDVEGSQGSPNVVGMVSPYACCSRFIFSSNIAANTFGKTVTLTDSLFTGGVPPILAYDSGTNRAVLAQAQGAPFSVPEILQVDLTSGANTSFQGMGFGLVNGMAVDSNTGIACTTTETDNSAEFYDLARETGQIVVLPNIGKFSGATVAVDPINKLFLIAHPVPTTNGEIHVYTEQGGLLESIFEVPMGPGGPIMAVNPSKRIVFVQVAGSNGASSGLQSFSY